MDIKKVLNKIPYSPGVYIFRDAKGEILYIGKSGSLKKRVSSYFQKKHASARTELMVSRIRDIDYIPTVSNAEALIYEASLIKEKKPKFNVALKDDKSYPYIKFTVKERYPMLLITREIERDGSLYYGPYTNAGLLREALTFMKRVFPLRTCNKLPKKVCLKFHLSQCLGPCVNKDNDSLYREAVGDVKLFLKGRRKKLIRRLSERMKRCADTKDYENALKIRGQMEALSVVIGQARRTLLLDGDLKELKDLLELRTMPARIEAFDISNIHGRDAVGSMVTFFNAKPLKSDYRRFRIRTVSGIDDYSMIREVVRRRYRRLVKETRKMPDLILIDGGPGHLSSALEEMRSLKLKIPVIAIAKREELIFTHGRKRPLKLSSRSKALKLIQRIRDEAHRFAISYHKLRRKKTMFGER